MYTSFLGMIQLNALIFAAAALVAAAAPIAASSSPDAPPRGAVVLSVCDDAHDPMTLDPQKGFSEKVLIVLQQVFEGLVRFGPEGAIEPALATEWRRVSPTVIRFKLREGVVFQDGEAFDAESVRFSVARYLDPATRFPALGFIDSIARVDVIDAHTVDLVTKYPDGLLLNRLAAFIVMVPPRYYREKPEEFLRENPVGSGAFEFKSWTKGKEIAFAANRRYWKPGHPKIDGLVFKFIPFEKQVDALLSGDIDVLTALPGTRTLDVQRSTSAFVVKKPTFYTVAGTFNASRKPFSSKRVREALNLGIDRGALVRYDLLGNGRPIGTLSLPGEFGHNARLEPYPYDPVKARRILSEEGYPHGLTLNVLIKTNALRTGQILAEQLRRIGARMRLTGSTDAELFELFKDKDRWDMAFGDCPDPMLHSFFIRSIFLAGSSPFTLSADAGIDARLAKLVTTLDPDAQRAISEELDAYIHSEYLAVPTFERVRTYGVRRGVVFTPYVSGTPYFDELALAGVNAR
jgi:peptide/nickel transport system substrate-binding protein